MLLKDRRYRLNNSMETNNSNYAFILGFYLGDGHIVKVGRSYRLSLYNDKNYEDINCELEKCLSKILPNNKVSRYDKQGCWKISVHSNSLIDMFPQHGIGRKHDRDLCLTDWQYDVINQYPKEFIKGLIYSDGCIVQSKYKRYEFSNRSKDIHEMLSYACSRIGIITNIRRKGKDSSKPTYNQWITSIGKQKYVKILSEFITDKS